MKTLIVPFCMLIALVVTPAILTHETPRPQPILSRTVVLPDVILQRAKVRSVHVPAVAAPVPTTAGARKAAVKPAPGSDRYLTL